MWQAAAGRPNHPLRRSCPPPHFPSPAWRPGSGGHVRIPKPKEHFFLSPPPLWLQHRPGRARSGCQVSYVTLSSAIFSQAQRNSRVAHAWRLHLIMCGVVTPDHGRPSPSLTSPSPPHASIQPIQQYAIRLLIFAAAWGGSSVDEQENVFAEQKRSRRDLIVPCNTSTITLWRISTFYSANTGKLNVTHSLTPNE